MTKHAYLLVVAAGCRFEASPARAIDAPIPDGDTAMWTFGSAAELGVTGAVAQDMTLEAHGGLTPAAYTYGGLVAHGLQGMRLWDRGDTSWTKLTGVVPTGAGLWRGEPLPSTSNLGYLGITDQSSMTIWFEGEVWLAAGSTETFTLSGDDLAFIDLARPGTTSYDHLTETNGTISVSTPDTGWYPIRIGYGNAGGGGSNFDFVHSDTGAIAVPWSRDRLRGRASELSGALRTVFGRQILGGGQALASGKFAPPLSTVAQTAVLAMTTFTTPPQGAADTDWSARYAGQVYVAQPGLYTLTATSDDGNRVRLGATGHGETHWARDDGVGATPDTSTAMANLVAGWNDLSVDHNQATGKATLLVSLAGPGTPDAAVPVYQLRPVESADDRLAFAEDNTAHLVPDGQGPTMPGTAVMNVGGYPGETVTSIELTYEIDAKHGPELKVDLETAAGPASRLTIRDTGTIPDGDHIAQLTVSAGSAGLTSLLGGPVNGAWKLHVYDNVGGGGDSSLKTARITLHTTGGPDKVARTASWTSPVLDGQTRVLAIDGATWDERVPDGATVAVYLRTCAQPDCSDTPWPTTPIARATQFAVPPGRYAQLRVAMTSNGAQEPELRMLAVTYRREPAQTLPQRR